MASRTVVPCSPPERDSAARVNLCADDWYILDAEKDSHVLVVYRGTNDAWDGYGGGTLYTRVRPRPSTPEAYVVYSWGFNYVDA